MNDKNCIELNIIANTAFFHFNADNNVKSMDNIKIIEAIILVMMNIDCNCSIGPTRNMMLYIYWI